MLSLLQYCFALAVLVYSSICDWRTRQVSNWLWVLSYPAGTSLTMIGLAVGALNVQAVIFSVVASCFLGFALLYVGFMGGADAKALLFVGLTVPSSAFKPLLNGVACPPALTMFFNATLLSLVCPLAVFALNFIEILRGKNLFMGVKATPREKVLMLFTTRKASLSKLEKGLVFFPAETVEDENGQLTRKPLHFVKAEADLTSQIATLKEHQELYADGILASPTIPFIIFFALALALLPFSGNILLMFMHRLSIHVFLT